MDGDAARLAQVMANLLTNAAKYTDAGGQIAVSGASEDSQAVLSVIDSGRGIAPEMLPRIFDLFAQERQEIDRSDGGLGLGLAIVKNLMRAHGGTVDAHSDGKNRGARFTIRIPLAARAAESRDIIGGGAGSGFLRCSLGFGFWSSTTTRTPQGCWPIPCRPLGTPPSSRSMDRALWRVPPRFTRMSCCSIWVFPSWTDSKWRSGSRPCRTGEGWSSSPSPGTVRISIGSGHVKADSTSTWSNRFASMHWRRGFAGARNGDTVAHLNRSMTKPRNGDGSRPRRRLLPGMAYG